MSQEGQVKKGITWSFVEGFGVKIVSTSVFLILAKLLGANQFGMIAIAAAFIDFGNVLAEQGMVAALVQKEKLERADLDTAFWINIGLGVVVFGIVFLISPFIAAMYGEPLLTPVLRTSALVFLIAPSGLVQVAQLTREMNFKAIARARIIGLLAGAIVSVAMAFMDYGVWALVFQKIIFISLSTLLFWFYKRWMPRLSFSRTHFRELFSFSYKMLLNNFMIYFSRNSPELIIGFFHGTAAAGLYSFSYKIFQSTIETANTSINKVMLPLFASVQNDKEQLVNYFYKAIGSTFMVMLPFLAMIILISPEAIRYFFNDSWAQGTELLKLVSIGGTIYMIFYFSNSVFISIGKPDLIMKFTFFDTVLNVSLIALASQLPLIYVGHASIVRSLVMLPVAYILLRQIVSINAGVVLQQLWKPTLIGCIAFFTLLLSSVLIPVLPLGWVWFVIQGVVWSVTVWVALYFILPSALTPVVAKASQFYFRLFSSQKSE